MKTEFESAASSKKQTGCAKKTRCLAGAIALGLFSGFLFGPGCISPKNFPRPPGLSLSSAPEINRRSSLQAQAFAPAQSLETISEKNN